MEGDRKRRRRGTVICVVCLPGSSLGGSAPASISSRKASLCLPRGARGTTGIHTATSCPVIGMVA